MKSRRECPKGHVCFKSSDCRTCPKCEAAKNRDVAFLAELAAPARRALLGAGLTTLAKLARSSEARVRELHGMGPNAISKLRASLKKSGLTFAKESP
jgi:predicted RecB family nuclease